MDIHLILNIRAILRIKLELEVIKSRIEIVFQ
jgi:hypothetical protein